MNAPPLPFASAVPAAAPRDEGFSGHPLRTDVAWGRPQFRPPTLPTPRQIHYDLPFMVNFSSKRTRSA
ncbi:MAG: hypothetical protein HZA93_19540 [Verrucomicrobia bacterium]|nr:hypothetical protein [Verrucomicrobiota bacterium]